MGIDKKLVLLMAGIVMISACKRQAEQKEDVSVQPAEEVQATPDTIITVKEQPRPSLDALNDTTFVRLQTYAPDFVYDLKYATDDNFLKAVVYDCAECYVRVLTAKALIKANTELMEKGYKIKFFDCYRPLDVQKKMWKIVPNPIYVADPAKGSIHNKGGAVDITLVDLEGNELDMGTPFDFFGREAHHAYQELPAKVLQNRLLLKETMERHGFWAITSEWWHYNLSALSNAPVANFRWECPEN